MKEALLWEKEKDKIRCVLCNHHCSIPEGKLGVCTVRENRDGTLYSLVYGKIVAMHIDPVEKKPLYHFYPGHPSFSIASVGCNFRCQFCQNADIAQMPHDHDGQIGGKDVEPEQVVDEALIDSCLSIAYTYTEPTVWYEFTKDCGELARKKGLKNIYVSNGFMTKEMINDAKFIDAANIDLKAFNDDFYKKTCGANLDPILDSLKYLKKKGVWVEVTTLIIPDKNDSNEELKQAAEFIADEMGKETPWHLSAFHPDYKMLDVPATPVDTLLRAYSIGKEAGLENVYVGNVNIDTGIDTECPKCGEKVIRRKWMQIIENKIKDNKCPKCGHKIAGYF
jgi:pyruvate formate lyase activating enzyme